ncbi:MAG: cation-translocating P-type ATPase, partial [Nanoarchaeota archaeon]|nr:cation-translocating P-type ATPase [Nanoarchaeota archaeon]
MKKVTLDISGMHCASCSTLINRALSKTKGVNEANVNYAAGKATVYFDDSLVKAEELVPVVISKGYGASIRVGNDADIQAKKQKQEIMF